MTTSMQGKICLITGGTSGIGKITALELARMGATVVVVGRNAQKTLQVVDEIRAMTGNQAVDSLLADLSSQQSIRQLADSFKSKYTQLHVLLNNAGAVFEKRKLSVDGYEMTFALNHLAYFLLTNLLLEPIIASAPARIINVSSSAHVAGRINFDNLQSEHSYSALGAYSNSKLANILFTVELSRRLEGTQVTANALHPGFVNTGLGRNNTGIFMQLVGAITPLLARTPERGAQTSIYLASSPAVEGITGKYFVNSKVKQPTRQTTDLALARKLWEVSAELVHMSDPVVKSA